MRFGTINSLWPIILFLNYCIAKHGIFFTENQIDDVFNLLTEKYESNLSVFNSIEEANGEEIEYFFHSDDKIIPTVLAPGKIVNIYFYKNNNNSQVDLSNIDNLSSYDVIFTETKADLQQFLKHTNVVLVDLASRSKYVPLIRILGPTKDSLEKIVTLADFRIRREIFFKEYIQETLPIFKTRPLNIEAKSKNVAVLVESAIHPALELVVRNVMYYLESGWSLIIYHSEENEFFVKNALKDLKNIEYRLPFTPIYSVAEYNRFMKKREFYESLDAKKVLIFQTDSIMLKKGIERFMKYDYVGAPWPWYGKAGNGGFSLRSVDAMIEGCIQNDHPDALEDFYFSRFIYSNNYKLAPFNEAYAFSREYRVKILDRESVEGGVEDAHMALHQTWMFEDRETFRKIVGKSIERLKAESNQELSEEL